MNPQKWLLLVSVGILLLQAACAPAAPSSACPESTIDTELLTDTENGYCLLYPTKYSTEVPGYIVINPASAPGDTLGDAWASIETEPAAGRSAAQAAEAQVSAAGQGFNITRSEAKVGGEQATVVDGLPGPDPWRKVFVVHADRLYTLTFLPWGSSPEAQPALEALYAMVMDSLRFLPPGGGQ